MDRRLRLAAFALLAVLPVVLAVGMNRTNNLAAANRLAAACMELRDARAASWAQGAAAFEALFLEDLDFVREIFMELGEEPCVEVDRRLHDPLAIGFLETWQGEPWPPERMEHLRGVIERARTRCPPFFTEFFARLAGTPEEAASLAAEGCASMFESFERFGRADREATEPVTLTEWPEYMELIADGVRLEAPTSP